MEAGSHIHHDVLTFFENCFVMFLRIKAVCLERVARVFNVPCATALGDGRRDRDVFEEKSPEWI